MLVLGIHDGHNSGATLLSDGKIVASVCEERLTRTKNEVGYPVHAIDDVLRIGGADAKMLDVVAFASNFMHTAEHLRNAKDWYRSGLLDQVKDAQKPPAYLKAVFDTRRAERILQAQDHLGVSPGKITFHDHHLAHGAAAYYGSPFPMQDETLILTCDGAGDGLCATVSIGRGTAIKRIATSGREASIGKIYSRVTYLLGLTPWEHEYKVMGLAPYADSARAARIRDLFKEIVVLAEGGLSFRNAGEIQSSYSYEFLRERLELARFDEIAGGVQMYCEEMLCDWVRNCIRHTGIRRIVCGGGVFMNVKANLKISQLDELEEMFVFPSCGDESLSLGAAWLEYYARPGYRANQKPAFDHLYLGGAFTRREIEHAIERRLSGAEVSIEHCGDIEEKIAARLAGNDVVARFSGGMEWGARALGNRSILANPRDWPNVEKINSMIKMRDFWMPFAPSMMAEKQDRYQRNPKRIDSPFMMFAYETLPLAAKELGAALHPRDKTARSQIVRRETAPKYWSLLRAFEAKTGISAVLNTSFNLHGYPLVYTPEDAIDVFMTSGLDCLALEDILITKNKGS